ncbi:transcription factor S-II, central domain-containing protein [Gaertneriomyces semiglobifer]|nr:transcription factor S-II, central domain-containing protein [Gaertneriomyces semiglobifer]
MDLSQQDTEKLGDQGDTYVATFNNFLATEAPPADQNADGATEEQNAATDLSDVFGLGSVDWQSTGFLGQGPLDTPLEEPTEQSDDNELSSLLSHETSILSGISNDQEAPVETDPLRRAHDGITNVRAVKSVTADDEEDQEEEEGEEDGDDDAHLHQTETPLLQADNSSELITPSDAGPTSTRVTRGRTINYKALLDGPSISRRLVPTRKSSRNDKGERVYCVCRQPDTGKWMIQCDNCSEWYHGSCVGLTKKAGQKLSQYHCPACAEIIGSTQKSEDAPAASPRETRRRSSSANPGEIKTSPSPACETPMRPTRAKPSTNGTRTAGTKIVIDLPTLPTSRRCQQAACEHAAVVGSNFCSVACEAQHAEDLATAIECKRPECLQKASRQAGFCSRDCAQSFAEEQRITGELASPDAAAAAEDESVPSDSLPDNPVRRMARRGFEEALKPIFQQAKENPEDFQNMISETIDLDDVKSFVVLLEAELFNAYHAPAKGAPKGTLECTADYKTRFRSLMFNLKDNRNLRLRRRILCGDVSPHELVRLPPEDLGNDDIKAAAEEARRRSLHDSIRIQEEDATFIRKTHKGEIEVVRAEEVVQDDGPMNYATSVHQALQTNAATPLIIKREKPKIAEPTRPAQLDTLEDILSRVEKRRMSDSGSASTKRSSDGPPFESAPLNKKKKMNDSPVLPETLTEERHGAQENVPASRYAESEDEPREDLVLEGDAAGEFADVDNAEDAPPIIPKDPELDPDAIVWRGRVHMQQVGKFQGICRQICGPPLGTMKTWEDVLPATISIEGRISPANVQKYLHEQRYTGGKQVVVVEFKPGEDEHLPSASDDDNGYKALFSYFRSRGRYAVVGHHYVSIKDMYLVPLGADEPIPPFMMDFGECRIQPAPRGSDVLLGVIILAKGFPVASFDTSGKEDSRKRQYTEAPMKQSVDDAKRRRPDEVRQSPMPPTTVNKPAIPVPVAPPVQPAIPNLAGLDTNSLLGLISNPGISGLLSQLSQSGGQASALTGLDLSSLGGAGALGNLLNSLPQSQHQQPQQVLNMLSAMGVNSMGMPAPSAFSQQSSSQQPPTGGQQSYSSYSGHDQHMNGGSQWSR